MKYSIAAFIALLFVVLFTAIASATPLSIPDGTEISHADLELLDEVGLIDLDAALLVGAKALLSLENFSGARFVDLSDLIGNRPDSMPFPGLELIWSGDRREMVPSLDAALTKLLCAQTPDLQFVHVREDKLLELDPVPLQILAQAAYGVTVEDLRGRTVPVDSVLPLLHSLPLFGGNLFAVSGVNPDSSHRLDNGIGLGYSFGSASVIAGYKLVNFGSVLEQPDSLSSAELLVRF